MKMIAAIRKSLCALLGSVLLNHSPLSAAEIVVPPAAPTTQPSSAATAAAPRLSDDGRWVAFNSEAGDLATGDANGAADVFLRDRQTGVTLLVSRRDDGGGSGNGVSVAPDLTPDGRYVVFQSTASDLVPPGWVPPTTNAWRSLIYRYDRLTGEMRLININRPAPTPNPLSLRTLTNSFRDLVLPAISPNGQRVLFAAGRNRLATSPIDTFTPREPDALFLWDASTGITDHLTDGAIYGGQQTDNAPLMSADARFVAFANTPEFLSIDAIWVSLVKMNVIASDRLAGTNFVPNWVHAGVGTVPTYSLVSGLSASGDFVLYEQRTVITGDSPNLFVGAQQNLWLHHLPSGQFQCVSTNSTAGQIGNEPSDHGALSADGNWAAYFSKASNLVAADINNLADVFLYDRVNQSNTRISTHAAWQGVIGGRVELAPTLTSDGRFVLYQAMGSGLFRYDRVTGTNALITADVEADGPDISADGRFVVFTALPSSINPADPNPRRQIYCHDFETGLTELITARDPAVPAATPNGPSALELAAVSATGRFIAFTSYADDVANDGSRAGRLWVRDTQLGTNILVSVDKDGQPLTGTETFRNVQLSADGRWVCFVAAATNLVVGDANNLDDVFLRDLQNGVTRLVSKLAAGGGVPNARSHSPALSRDGSMLVFKSDGTGITSSGSIYDLYAHSVSENTNRIATQVINELGGPPSVSSQCELPVISPDGRWLMFRSQAYNLYRESTAGFNKLVLKDLTLQFGGHFVEAHRVDIGPQNQLLPGNDPVDWAFSPDSQWLVFSHRNNQDSAVYRRPTASGPVELVTTNGFRPLIANGGNIVAWQSQMPALGYTDSNATWDVFHRRIAEGVTKVISVGQSGTATGNGASRLVALSPDGRYVLFRSHAADLVAGDANRSLDLFLRDTATDVTVLLSRNLSNVGAGDSFSCKAVFTDDGTKIVFESYASDLVANDFNLERDVFIAQLQLPDSDNDQLPDDWELTYFNSLDHDGTADSDQDGLSDLAEFRAGTSPINTGSILQAIAVTGVGSGSTTVSWSSVPGRSYQVQSRDSFSQPGWNPVGTAITAKGSSTSVPDPAPSDPDRFYRVLLIE